MTNPTEDKPANPEEAATARAVLLAPHAADAACAGQEPDNLDMCECFKAQYFAAQEPDPAE